MKNRLAPRRAMMRTSPEQILRPVVALDIDGTLGYYHEHFYRYAQLFLQRELPTEWDGEAPFWKSCGVSKTTYREMKLGYRQGRMKRSMPVVEGAYELTRDVRAAGAEVWVCTTRPYLRLDNIDPDTRWWLRHNRIQYDGVLFGENKYRDLARMVGSERVLGVLDDDPEQTTKALRAGLPSVYLIDRTYNRGEISGHCRGWRFSELSDARLEFVESCQEWRRTHGV